MKMSDQSPPNCSASSEVPETCRLLQVHRTKYSSSWHKTSSQYVGNELGYYLWARAVRNIHWKHAFHFLQIGDWRYVKALVCVKTGVLRDLSLSLILCNLSICSPALTLPMLLLDACEFQVLEYYNHLLQVSVKHFLQLLYINPISGSHNSSYCYSCSLTLLLLLPHLLWNPRG